MIQSNRFQAAAAVLALGAVAIVLRAFPPDRAAFYPSCPFHALTGLLCPGCGGTRALAALVAGRWGDAVHCNVLVSLSAPLLAARILWVSVVRKDIVIPARIVPYLLTVAAIFGLARNIP